tara:strand:- start:2964 stop:4757 length:1794 start_codon:yes stop_codon:yes gene_type:complete
MRYCFVKQDVYQDLYVADLKCNNKDILFSSMMRVGPFGLIYNKNADFYIIKEEDTEECQIYKNFLHNFGGNYQKLKTDILNKIPNNEFFEPGSDKPNGFYSISCNDINWNMYDIVISINFSIPIYIINNHPNTLWCYLIGENNRHLLDNPKYKYDVALNQDIDIDYIVNNNVVQFPYTFLEKNTLFDIMNKDNDYIKDSIFIEINSCRGRPVQNYPSIFNKLKDSFNLSIKLHQQNIKKNLKHLYHSKYFIKYGGRSIRGNSVIEAISCNCLVIMDNTMLGYKFLIPDICNIKTETDVYNKVKYFENNNNIYNDTLMIQKNLLQKYVYNRPIENLERLFYIKNNYCVVFVSDIRYYQDFLKTLKQLVVVGEYQGPIVLLASEELYNSNLLNDEFVVKYKVIIYNFKNISNILKEETIQYYNTNRKYGRKNKDWSFGTFNKFNLFQEELKKYRYILYLDCGIKFYKPIRELFDLKLDNKILAHEDEFPKYRYNLSSKFYKENPYFNKLSNDFNLETKHFFQTTIMLYDTSIIEKDTVKNICNLVDKYPISMNGDQEYISLYFKEMKGIMDQIKISNNDYYYYDYFQRFGINKYVITKK